jgi:8-oxo-dGTP pyrophosphatase MutT (NUDIX family)
MSNSNNAEEMLEPFALSEEKNVFQCSIFQVKEQKAITKDKKHSLNVYTLNCADWVNVIPITATGQVVLIEQHRFGTNTFTLEVPGGAVEYNEKDATLAALRELEEETGIKAKKLQSLGSEQVKNPNAPELMINCFKYETDESTSMRDDPDTEVKKWVWVSTPISEDILDNLHAKKNVTLKLLGLQKWEKSFVNQLSTAYNNLIKLLYQ